MVRPFICLYFLLFPADFCGKEKSPGKYRMCPCRPRSERWLGVGEGGGGRCPANGAIAFPARLFSVLFQIAKRHVWCRLCFMGNEAMSPAFSACALIPGAGVN